jgi:hypothetical protein
MRRREVVRVKGTSAWSAAIGICVDKQWLVPEVAFDFSSLRWCSVSDVTYLSRDIKLPHRSKRQIVVSLLSWVG